MTRPSSDLLKVLHRAPSPAYATDDGNRIIAWNDAAEQLLGHAAEDAVGKPCHALIGGKDIYGNTFCDRECSVLKMVRRNQQVRRFAMDVRRSSGEPMRVHCSILALPEESGSGFSMVHLLERADAEVARRERPEADPAPARSSPDRPSSSAWAQLTGREREILRMLAAGAGTRDIADSLSISPLTVRTHVRNVLRKLGVHGRLEAVMTALRDQLI